MTFIAETANRVPQNTLESVNLKIELDMIRRLEKIGNDTSLIKKRLKELDSEWDIERAIEMNASSLLLTTLALGVAVNKKWFLVSGAIAGFLFQHAIQGWCPPVPILRRLGFRTQREINNERTILISKIMPLPQAASKPHEALEMIKH